MSKRQFGIDDKSIEATLNHDTTDPDLARKARMNRVRFYSEYTEYERWAADGFVAGAPLENDDEGWSDV